MQPMNPLEVTQDHTLFSCQRPHKSTVLLHDFQRVQRLHESTFHPYTVSRASKNHTRMGCAVFGDWRQTPQKNILKSYFKKDLVWPRTALDRSHEPVNRKRTPPEDTGANPGELWATRPITLFPKAHTYLGTAQGTFLNSSGWTRAEVKGHDSNSGPASIAKCH